MRVHDIMTAKPILIHPRDTIAKALRLMSDGGFNHLPVVSSSKHLIGVISSRDCRVALDVADLQDIPSDKYPHAKQILVRDAMSRAPVVTTPGTDIFDAATLMYSNHINCLPVMLEETLVGIVTSSDLLVACIQIARKDRILQRK